MSELGRVVLVIVADPSLRRFVGRAIEELDYHPVLAASWSDAFERVSARPRAIVVHASDIPYARNAALMARTNWRAPVSLVILTQRNAVRDVARLIGAIDILRLPLNLDLLLATIDRAVSIGDE